MHMSKYLHCLSRDKLRKLTMTLHMLAQTDLLSWSKHFFVIFLSIMTLSFLLSFILLNAIIDSHSSISYSRSSCILQWDSHCFSEHNWSQQPELSISFATNIVTSWHQIHMWLLYCVNTIFKKEEKSRKVNFLIIINKKVNFSYWLSFLLLSWDSYMPVSIFFFIFFIFFRNLQSQFNNQNKTLSFILSKHNKNKIIMLRPSQRITRLQTVRSFVSIHSHQQHHSHQKHWMCCNL
jgi:hypothetical protein